MPRLVVLALLLAVALAGCGDGSDDPTTTAGATAAAVLAITERVAAGTLAGLPASGGPAEHGTPEALVAASPNPGDASDVAALRDAGFVAGATQRFGNGRSTIAISAAVRTGAPEQARAVIARLVQTGLTAPAGARVERGTLDGVPGSTTVVASTQTAAGVPAQYGGVYFTDGPYAYAQVAAVAGTLDAAALRRDALALYQRVRGR